MTQEHGRGAEAAREEPLTPPDTRAPSHAERVRTLLAARTTGALSSIAREPAGYPFATFVTYAMLEGDPIFLVSRLAEHTKNLAADARASLLVAEDGASDPLANARVTVVGPCTRVHEPAAAREAFLAVHPGASFYADFSDFAFFRLAVEAVRYIGGYGRMSWVGLEEYGAARPDPLAPHAEAILGHMNADHADALALYARAFTRASDAERATMTGIDRHGFELSVTTARGPRPARIAFERTIETPEAARAALVALVRRARG